MALYEKFNVERPGYITPLAISRSGRWRSDGDDDAGYLFCGIKRPERRPPRSQHAEYTAMIPFLSGTVAPSHSARRGPDPAFWVNRGYVFLNPDPRGVYKSQGNISYWGRQLAEDGYDFIEWAAQQPWCSGKVGMAGNSWLAVSQWFIAAEQPPHLTAIAPWEGFVDHFRETGNRGGIPAPAFPEVILKTFAGEHLVEDQPRMISEKQLIDPYWEDKIARLEQINIPAYVVASYTNHAHTHGSFAGYRQIASKAKWLRVNNTNEWLDFYTPKYTNELLAFFDHYLKGKENGWGNTPQVRICILDEGGTDTVDRVEQCWPPLKTKLKKMFISGPSQLATAHQPETSSLSYEVSGKGNIELHYIFSEETEITGYMKVKLWVEARGADDMELEVGIEKRDRHGTPHERLLGEGIKDPVVASGMLRVSQRALDPSRSTEEEPFLLHTREDKLHPGEIVPIEVGIWPMAMRYHATECHPGVTQGWSSEVHPFRHSPMTSGRGDRVGNDPVVIGYETA